MVTQQLVPPSQTAQRPLTPGAETAADILVVFGITGDLAIRQQSHCGSAQHTKLRIPIHDDCELCNRYFPGS
jgi:hypothetical protein